VEHVHQARGPAGLREEGAGRDSVRRMAVSLALTAGLMLAEAVGGWLSGSLCLV
jgi:Co/Zn/Cd efflux system component